MLAWKAGSGFVKVFSCAQAPLNCRGFPSGQQCHSFFVVGRTPARVPLDPLFLNEISLIQTRASRRGRRLRTWVRPSTKNERHWVGNPPYNGILRDSSTPVFVRLKDRRQKAIAAPLST
jgi:hypothetical protein